MIEMIKMKKIEEYDILTERNLGFELEIYEDVDKGEFSGRLHSYSPMVVPLKEPGMPLTRLKIGASQELRNKDKGNLIETCKGHIIKIGGEIIKFTKVSA